MNFVSGREGGGTAARARAKEARSWRHRYAVLQHDQARRAYAEVGRELAEALAERAEVGLRLPLCDTARRVSGALLCWPVSSGTKARNIAPRRLLATSPISNATG